MSEGNSQVYPQNLAYIAGNSIHNTTPARPSQSNSEHHNDQGNGSNVNVEYLMARVSDLQEQLSALAGVLSQQGKDNLSNYQQISQQNEQLRMLLIEKEERQAQFQLKLAQKAQQNNLIRQSLLKQNEEMEQLHYQLKQCQMKASRINDRSNNPELQQKVIYLNDQVSNLLIKIKDYVDENNEQQNIIEEYMTKINQQNIQLESMHKIIQQHQLRMRELGDQNQYLKEQIKNVDDLSINQQKNTQDKYLKELAEAQQQLEVLNSAIQKYQREGKAGQIRNNSDRSNEDIQVLQKQVKNLKNQVHTLSQELLQAKQIQKSIKKKYEEKLNISDNQICSLNEQISKLKIKCRESQSAKSEYQYEVQQKQKQKQRLSFYKNNYSQVEQYKNIIVRLQAEKDQLNRKLGKGDQFYIMQRREWNVDTSKITEELLVKQFENKFKVVRESQRQNEQQLQKSKELIKQLKKMNKKHQQDYHELIRQYQRILSQKQTMELNMKSNQTELVKHKQIYQNIVRKYDQTSHQFIDLQQKIKFLEADRMNSNSNKIHHTFTKFSSNVQSVQSNYDKQNSDLIRLQNSTLNHELKALSKQNETLLSQNKKLGKQLLLLREFKEVDKYKVNILSAPKHDVIDDYQRMRQRQLERAKQRETQLQAQIEKLHKKYIDEMQKNKNKSESQQRINQLQHQLTRVNKMLNQKINELDQVKTREEELNNQLNAGYKKYALQFNTYGIKHHPQVKKLQTQIITLQRQLMESQFQFKQKISQYDDDLKTTRLENQHHRKKIQELLQQLAHERSSVDYNKMARRYELSQLKIKQYQSQFNYKNAIIGDLTEQLKKIQGKQRQKIEERINKEDIRHLQQKNQVLMQNISNHQKNITRLTQYLNSVNPSDYTQNSIDRAIKLIQQLKLKKNERNNDQFENDRYNVNSSDLNDTGRSVKSQQIIDENRLSRYEQLQRQKKQIRSQFQQSQQYLKQVIKGDYQGNSSIHEEGSQLRQNRRGIFQRLRLEMNP